MLRRYLFVIIAVIIASSSILVIVNFIEEQKIEQKRILDYNYYKNKGFNEHSIQQIINCDPTDTDRGIRTNRIANDTHEFDKINCVWNKLN